MRCTPSAAYQPTTASTLCAFHAAAQPTASCSLTSSSWTTAVTRCDEHDLALGEPLALALGGAPHEDLATLDPVDAGLVVDPLVQRRRPQHLHDERARVAGAARCGLRRAEQVVERG